MSASTGVCQLKEPRRGAYLVGRVAWNGPEYCRYLLIPLALEHGNGDQQTEEGRSVVFNQGLPINCEVSHLAGIAEHACKTWVVGCAVMGVQVPVYHRAEHT